MTINNITMKKRINNKKLSQKNKYDADKIVNIEDGWLTMYGRKVKITETIRTLCKCEKEMSQLYITDSPSSFMLCKTHSWVMFPSPDKGILEVLRVISLAKDAKDAREALESVRNRRVVRT